MESSECLADSVTIGFKLQWLSAHSDELFNAQILPLVTWSAYRLVKSLRQSQLRLLISFVCTLLLSAILTSQVLMFWSF